MPLFFVTLLPPDDVQKNIEEIKKEISEKYKTTRALRLPAHITLLPPFHVEDEQVAELKNRLRIFCSGQPMFPVELDGFGAFPPKVIYLKVANPNSVRFLQTELQNDLQELLPKNREAKEFRPHITLASRDILRSDFKKAWKEVVNRKFSATFKVETVYLFLHNGKRWDLVQEFPFS